MSGIWSRRLVGLLGLVASATLVSAHNGPPFPIIEGKRVGSCMVSLWTHPDVGIGTFFAILDAVPGGAIPHDLQIEVAVQPVSGRLAEARYNARREDLRGQVQYKAEVNFDADEMWRVRLLMHSSQCGGELSATVEATPPGFGRWDLLWFAAPFLGAGFLWFHAMRRRKAQARPR
jgi:hypothetical protein